MPRYLSGRVRRLKTEPVIHMASNLVLRGIAGILKKAKMYLKLPFPCSEAFVGYTPYCEGTQGRLKLNSLICIGIACAVWRVAGDIEYAEDTLRLLNWLEICISRYLYVIK